MLSTCRRSIYESAPWSMEAWSRPLENAPLASTRLAGTGNNSTVNSNSVNIVVVPLCMYTVYTRIRHADCLKRITILRVQITLEMGSVCRVVTGHRKPYDWQCTSTSDVTKGLFVSNTFVLIRRVTWHRPDWNLHLCMCACVSAIANVPFICTIYSSEPFRFVKQSQSTIFCVRCGTPRGIITHWLRSETHRDMAAWARSLVQGTHNAINYQREFSFRCVFQVRIRNDAIYVSTLWMWMCLLSISNHVNWLQFLPFSAQ